MKWARRRCRIQSHRVSNKNNAELELELDSVEPITRFVDILTATVLTIKAEYLKYARI